MQQPIAKAACRLIEAGGSVVGFRRFTEEPLHTAEQLEDGIELRRYGTRIAAETTIVGDEEAARQIGFRRLARYIFGSNHTAAAMPVPVHRQTGARRGEKIAMTTPVSQQASPDGQWTIRFFMPSRKTLESLPAPDDPSVSLLAAPAETVAVRRFSGSISPRAVASQTESLLRALRNHGYEPTDSPAAWFYDPPWTIPFLRRNEIAVPVRRVAGQAD